jgi:hypothetical protein
MHLQMCWVVYERAYGVYKYLGLLIKALLMLAAPVPTFTIATVANTCGSITSPSCLNAARFSRFLLNPDSLAGAACYGNWESFDVDLGALIFQFRILHRY